MVGTELAVSVKFESVLFSLLNEVLDFRRMSLKKAGAMTAEFEPVVCSRRYTRSGIMYTLHSSKGFVEPIANWLIV